MERRHVIALVEAKASGTPIAGNMLLSIIRSMFNWAIKNEVYRDGQNPAAQVDAPAAATARDRWLSEEEIRIFWTKLETAAMSPECRAALRLILITAQRSGEVLSAEWRELAIDRGWWIIPATKAKNKLRYGVPLSSLAIEEIGRLGPSDGGYLFPGRYAKEKHLTVAALSNAVAANRSHFGLAQFTPHDLRRSSASHLTHTCGVSQFIVGKILNHAEKGVTRVYDRNAYNSEKKAALDRWDRELRRILGRRVTAKVLEIAG